MISWSRSVRRAVGIAAAFAAFGCTTSSNLIAVQGKYTYPNGDYDFKGHASAETHYTRFLSAPVMGRQEFYDLQQKALETQPGSDLMADYLVSSDVTALPGIFLPLVTFTTFRLEGTAIQFRELGRQQYRQAPDNNPPKAVQ